MHTATKHWLPAIVSTLSFCLLFLLVPLIASAINMAEYKDTLSDSAPSAKANHTVEFVVKTDLSPGSVVEITPPPGFKVLPASILGLRNVELRVDGVLRTAAATPAPGVDGIEITAGNPGFFKYTLAPGSGISSGSRLQFKIGSHTSTALQPVTSYSTSTGTTTTPGDSEPIVNSSTLGRHDLTVEIFDGSLVANANPIVFLNKRVSMPSLDTTEEVPPFRFNPQPTSVGGTTPNVAISLETDEFALCRYSLTPGVDFSAMTESFYDNSSGYSQGAWWVFHNQVVPVTPDTNYTYYVRCLDDEGNFNVDDFEISFFVEPVPTGSSTTEGGSEGDGTGESAGGTGDNESGGTGSGSGSGSGSGAAGGSSSGSGGGGGGGGGSTSGSSAGGGFESTDGPFRSGDGRIIVSGYGYPDADITILADGQKLDTVRANNDGRYSITIDEVGRGVYTFGVYAMGSDRVKSSTFSTSFTVTGARTSALSNINVVPSILVEPDPVDPGQTLTVSGYALPEANITLENSRSKAGMSKKVQAVSDGNGKWSTTIDTSEFSRGTYKIRAKAEQVDGKSTEFSDYVYYGVGQAADQPINTDLNQDGDVNLIDFSILLFWWNSDGGDSNPPADINQDGTVSLTDFSIMLFGWTG